MDLPPSAKEAVESLVKVYGPFAFGIVSLLVIWFSIISPELNRKQLDFEQYSTLIKQHQSVNQQTETVARAMHDTAMILDKVTQRLEKLDANK